MFSREFHKKGPIEATGPIMAEDEGLVYILARYL
jgi:hypothetical protein